MKLILKLLVTYLVLFGMALFLPEDIAFVVMNILLFFATLLLLIIVSALKQLNAFQKGDPYSKICFNGVNVNFLWRLNGGGVLLAYEYLRIVSQKIGKVPHVFEYCAGPGFIGFSLLANNLCDKLTLADVNPQALAAIKETIKENQLEDKVTVYESDCLAAIPESEQWDLVVGNPPWRLSSKKGKDLLIDDPESRVHKNFYKDVTRFLKPGGSVLLVEGGEFTDVRCFKDMIESNGLSIVESFKAVTLRGFFKDWRAYNGLKFPLVIFLRISMFVREVYFIWSRR